jgi:hypothetical protein
MRTYTHKFTCRDQSWTCTFDVSITDAHMNWSPECPSEEVPIWREYRRWRDRCLRKFGRQTRVYHEIRVDIPQAGLRVRFTSTVSREATYAHARASYSEIASSKGQGAQRETRDRMLQDFGAVMLATLPNGAMQ